MDFQEELTKYKNNTATEEESAFVEKTVMDARKIAKTRLHGDKRTTVGQRIKRFIIKLIVFIVLLLSLFGFSYYKMSSYGKENINYSKQTAETMIENYLVKQTNSNTLKIDFSSYKRKLVMSVPFERSYYLYQFEVKYNSKVYTIYFDSFTGYIQQVSISY